MKKLYTILTFVMLATVLSASAFAQNSRGIDRRQHEQRDRIQQGVRSGELTRREANRLRHDQFQIRRLERRAEADGVLTARERFRINRNLNESSRDIRRLKHNRRDR
jgi:hypothetical protein